MSIGRNDPCPCGSGKKFKACCLPLGRRLASSPEAPEGGDLPTRYRELLALGLASGEGVEMAELRAAVALAASQEDAEGEGGRRPDVRNTDGDELVFTSLRWAVSDEAAVREALSRLDGLDLEETPEGLAGTFVRKQGPKQRHLPGDSVTIGTLLLNGAVLTVEVNSVERAEKLRRKPDRALGRAATFRTVTSEPLDEAMKWPVDPLAAARANAEQERLMALPEVREAMAKMGREHSLAWCDLVIPALGNRKPRILVKTEKGRQKVEARLADFERRQAGREHSGMGMDLELIRKELGLV